MLNRQMHILVTNADILAYFRTASSEPVSSKALAKALDVEVDLVEECLLLLMEEGSVHRFGTESEPLYHTRSDMISTVEFKSLDNDT